MTTYNEWQEQNMWPEVSFCFYFILFYFIILYYVYILSFVDKSIFLLIFYIYENILFHASLLCHFSFFSYLAILSLLINYYFIMILQHDFGKNYYRIYNLNLKSFLIMTILVLINQQQQL